MVDSDTPIDLANTLLGIASRSAARRKAVVRTAASDGVG
jgi:hypothetical protein